MEQLQRETSELESTKTVIEGYVSRLQVEDCCPLCNRDFAEKQENIALREQVWTQHHHMKSLGSTFASEIKQPPH